MKSEGQVRITARERKEERKLHAKRLARKTSGGGTGCASGKQSGELALLLTNGTTRHLLHFALLDQGTSARHLNANL